MNSPAPSSSPLGRAAALGSAVIALAVIAAGVLPLDPRLALFGAPFVVALADASIVLVARLGRPRVGVVVFARFVTAAVNLIGLQVVLALAESPGAPLAHWVLPATAVVVALGWVFGAVGGALPSTNIADGALVSFGDGAVTILAFLCAAVPVVSSQPTRVRLFEASVVAIAFVARAFFVGVVVARARAKPYSPVRAAIAFVAWLALAAFLATVAGRLVAWCGLGAAVVITFGSVLRESRRARPDATTPLGRSAVAFLVAAVLAILVIVARA